jgi:cobyrinic acid a,c-diamide synthase
VAEQVDLEAVVALARTAPARVEGEPPLPSAGPPVRIAVAAGAAFTFTYTDTTEALAAAGAEVLPFDPRHDEALPDDLDGLLIGGGFPEVFVDDLAGNQPLTAALRTRIHGGLPTWAECGGLLWLCRTFQGHPGVGVIEADAAMTERLTLGYRTATTQCATPLGPAGTELRGHEFHYGAVEPAGGALELTSRWSTRHEGHATPQLLATFLHHHPGGDPSAVAAFVAACARARGTG